MKGRIGVILLTTMLAASVACVPSAGEISGASDSELNAAGNALPRVGYDY